MLKSYAWFKIGLQNKIIFYNKRNESIVWIHESSHALLTYIIDVKYNGYNAFDFVINISHKDFLGVTYKSFKKNY